MFSKSFRFDIPMRLWRQVLAASDGDEQLASVTLATAFLVAAEHCASPPVPARRPRMRPWLDDSYRAREPQELTQGADVPHLDGYQVSEGPPHEMPTPDPWARSWD
jgi:hypothetical protein